MDSNESLNSPDVKSDLQFNSNSSLSEALKKTNTASKSSSKSPSRIGSRKTSPNQSPISSNQQLAQPRPSFKESFNLWLNEALSVEYAQKKFEEIESLMDSGFENWLSKYYLFGHEFNNSILIIVVMVTTWFLTYFRFGFSWFFVYAIAFVIYYSRSLTFCKLSIAHKKRHDEALAILDCASETTEWLNVILKRFWRQFEPYLSDTILYSVNPILEDYCPGFLDSVALTEFTLGSLAPRVEWIKGSQKTDNETIIINSFVTFVAADASVHPNEASSRIVLTVRVGKGIASGGLPILVQNIAFQAKCQIRITLVSSFPHIKLVGLQLLDKPTMDFHLTPVGGSLGPNIMSLPMLSDFIRTTVNMVLGWMMIAPNEYVLDIEQLLQGEITDAAIGVLKVTIREAKDVNAKEGATTDPYVKLFLNDQLMYKTEVIVNNSVHPFWNETEYVLIKNFDDAKLRFEVMDDNKLRKDTALGHAELALSNLIPNEEIHSDLPLITKHGSTTQGMISCYTEWYPKEVDASMDESELDQETCGILRFVLHCVKDLDPKKSSTGKYNPYCCVEFNGKEILKTKMRKRNNSPVFEESKEIFVRRLGNAKLIFTVFDKRDLSSNLAISNASLSLLDILNAIKGGNTKDWFPLSDGGSIRVTFLFTKMSIRDVSMSKWSRFQRPSIGVIKIKILKAHDLIKTDVLGKSDAYVRIRIASKVITQTSVQLETLNPVWMETFYLTTSNPRDTISLEVVDYNKFSNDELIGMAEVDMRNFIHSTIEDESEIFHSNELKMVRNKLYFSKKDAKDRGIIFYDIAFSPIMEIPQVTTAKKEESTNSQSIQLKPIETIEQVSGVLRLYIKKAVNLSKDSKSFCEVFINEKFIYKTEYSERRTSNPEWEEAFEVFVNEIDHCIVTLKCRRGPEDTDILGVFESPLKTIFEKAPEDELFSFNDGSLGKIGCIFTLKPVDIALEESDMFINTGKLHVGILKASNLRVADRGGTSDPYCKVYLNNDLVHKTEIIKKNLNPIFNEFFELEITDRHISVLRFELMDWDLVGGHDFLGVIDLPLSALPLNSQEEKILRLTQSDTGEITIRFLYTPCFIKPKLIKNKTANEGIAQSIKGSVVGKIGQAGDTFSSFTGAITKKITHPLSKDKIKGKQPEEASFSAGGTGTMAAFSSLFGQVEENEESENMKMETQESENNNSNLSKQNEVDKTDGDEKENEGMANEGQTTNVSEIRKRTDTVESTDSISIQSGVLAASLDNMKQLKDDPLNGQLKIRIIEASNLYGPDIGGTCDPYVKVKMGKKTIYKTRRFKKNNNPKWDESFTLPCHSLNSQFQLLVKDHNVIQSDELIGEYLLNVEEAFRLEGTVKESNGEIRIDFWTDVLQEKNQGKLHLFVQYLPNQTK